MAAVEGLRGHRARHQQVAAAAVLRAQEALERRGLLERLEQMAGPQAVRVQQALRQRGRAAPEVVDQVLPAVRVTLEGWLLFRVLAAVAAAENHLRQYTTLVGLEVERQAYLVGRGALLG